MKKKTEKKAQSFLVTDDAGMVLRIETEGKWLIVTSPFDPELVTQAKTIDEAFAMAYDAKKGLEALRAEAILARKESDKSPTSCQRKPVPSLSKRSSRPSRKRIGVRT